MAVYTARTIPTPDGPMTRRAAAKFYGIPVNTITRRHWEGLTPQQVCTPNPRPKPVPKPGGRSYHYLGHVVTPWGRMGALKLSRQLGMSLSGTVYRLTRWPLEDVLNTPSFGRRGVHFRMPPDLFKRLLAAAQLEDAASGNQNSP